MIWYGLQLDWAMSGSDEGVKHVLYSIQRNLHMSLETGRRIS